MSSYDEFLRIIGNSLRRVIISDHHNLLNVVLYIFMVIFTFNFNVLSFKSKLMFVMTSMGFIFSLFLYENRYNEINKKTKLLEHTFHNIPFALLVLENNQIIWINDLFRLTLGKEIENPNDILNNFDDYPEIRHAFEEVFQKNNETIEVELMNERWKIFSNVFQLDSYNVKIVGIIDITGRKQQNNKEALLISIISNLNLGIVIVKNDGNIILANNLANQIFNMNVVGKHSNTIGLFKMDNFQWKENKYITVNSMKYNNEYTVFKLEINEVKISDEINEAPFGVFVVGQERNVILINKYLMKLKPNQQIKYIEDLITDNQKDEFCQYFMQLVSGKKVNPSIFKTTSETIATVYVKPWKNKMFIVYFIDDPFVRELYGSFMHEQRLQSLGEIVGSVAHDFNNSIMAILSFADMILARSTFLPNEVNYMDLIKIKHNAAKAANLIKQILNVSRKQNLKEEIIDINELISEFTATIGRVLGENIEIQVYKNKSIPRILMNEVNFEQILINLLTNGRDSMPYGGTIKISTDIVSFTKSFIDNGFHISSGEYVEITVEDSGTGISQENLKQIFDPFFTTKDKKGTGFGLATVHSLVRQQRGFIKVNSRINIGTTFKLYIPHVSDRSNIKSSNTLKVDSLSKEVITKHEILLVEDEKSIMDFIKNSFSSFNITFSNNAIEAIKMLGNFRDLKLLITDLMLPNINGQELYYKVQQKFPNVKVLFISGYGQNMIEIKNAYFLQKPFSIKELREKIEEILR
jgi:nitrogen-specific signal transduction histidine kinase/CheY-like chemotaxis protein